MRTFRGLERLLTFGDAVVAIAITLLVLPLVELAPTGEETSVGDLLSDHLGELGAFALSFWVIARLWRIHHRIFERVGGYDSTLVSLTMAWLATVVFLPFPTELLGTEYDDGVSALYIGTLFASSLALGAADAWVRSHPGLELEEARGAIAEEPLWTSTILLAVALAVVVAVPSAGMWPLLLLVLSGPIDGLRRRRARPAP